MADYAALLSFRQASMCSTLSVSRLQEHLDCTGQCGASVLPERGCLGQSGHGLRRAWANHVLPRGRRPGDLAKRPTSMYSSDYSDSEQDDAPDPRSRRKKSGVMKLKPPASGPRSRRRSTIATKSLASSKPFAPTRPLGDPQAYLYPKGHATQRKQGPQVPPKAVCLPAAWTAVRLKLSARPDCAQGCRVCARFPAIASRLL